MVLLVAACAGSAGGARQAPDPNTLPWRALDASVRAERLRRTLGADFRRVSLPEAVLRFLEIGPAQGGDAGPILFVHGLGGALGDFAPVFARYAREGIRRVVAVDLPGWGESLSRNNDHRVTGYADTLVAFIERVRLEKVHLVCHSLGGQVCLAIALGRRDLVRSLTLISPAGVYQAEHYARAAARQFGRVNIGTVARTDRGRSLVAALSTPGGDFARRFVTRDRVALAMLSSFHENMRDRLTGLRVPTLVIWGTADPVLPMADGFVVAASVPGAVLHVVQGAGHEPHLTNPEQVHAWIEAHHRRH